MPLAFVGTISLAILADILAMSSLIVALTGWWLRRGRHGALANVLVVGALAVVGFGLGIQVGAGAPLPGMLVSIGAVVIIGGLGLAMWWVPNDRRQAVTAAAAPAPTRVDRAFAIGRQGFLEIDVRTRTIVLVQGVDEVVGLFRSSFRHLDDLHRVFEAGEWQRLDATVRLIEVGLARGASGDFYRRLAGGGRHWCNIQLDLIECDEHGRASRFLLVIADVDDRKKREVQLAHLALHDALTGLANRAAFLQMQRSRTFSSNALMLIDLDRFKQVNDRNGHVVGDAWLTEVGRRIRETVRREDFAARIGGDEFAVIPAGLIDSAAAEDLASRIVAALTEPFVLGGTTIRGGASVGVAVAAEHRDGERLYATADHALYGAKRHRMVRFKVLNDDDRAVSARARAFGRVRRRQ